MRIRENRSVNAKTVREKKNAARREREREEGEGDGGGSGGGAWTETQETSKIDK